MKYTTLIIYSEKRQREELRVFLTSRGDFDCHEFEDESSAVEWMNKKKKKVDFVFNAWDLDHLKNRTFSQLRENEYSSSAFIYPVASKEDLAWIRTIFGTPDLIDHILIKPFRAQSFVQRIRQLLSSSLDKKPAVLIVEDNDGARETIRGYLKQVGFLKMYEAQNGKEGFNLLEKHSAEIGLIVSDWEMPIMNGLQFLKKVREKEKLGAIPFVMVTSQTSIEQIKMIQAAEYAVNGYIQKPFNLQSFRSQIEQVILEAERVKSAEAYALEGRALIASGNPNEATRLMSEAALKLPQSAILLETLGDAYWACGAQSPSQNFHSRAADAYERALKCGSPKKGLVIKCFEAFVAIGKMNEAVRVLRNQLEGKGFDDELITHLGKIYLRFGDYEAAKAELKRALTINPENTEASSLLQVANSLTETKVKKSSAK